MFDCSGILKHLVKLTLVIWGGYCSRYHEWAFATKGAADGSAAWFIRSHSSRCSLGVSL